MYERLGTVWERPQLEFSLIWNPPGWGSGPTTLDTFQGRRVALAMVVGIKPGGHIPFHRDNPAAENGLGTTRLDRQHVVLETNPHCWNFHDGVWQQLDVGVIYRM